MRRRQGRFGAAQQFVHRNAECVGERNELPGLGQGLARFPFGNRPVCYAQLIGKLLLRDANVLLLDEPTKGLDAYAKQNLAQIIKKLAAEDAAILIVTHDVEFAAQYATRCALMFDGTLLSGDEPHAFFAGNRFYTTDANRIASNYLPQAITCEEVIAACRDSL